MPDSNEPPDSRPRAELLEETAEATNADAPAPFQAPDLRIYLAVSDAAGSRIVDVNDGDEILFGRSPDARVAVDDAKVSRSHAYVRRNGNALVLEDLGSRNGTQLNDKKVHGSAVAVSGGDVIRVGPVRAVVAVSEAPAATARTAQRPASVADGVLIADPKMAEVYATARRLAGVETTVLILGETGVGKEVLAEQIHRWSARGHARFVRLNCASLPETLLESELFGHEKGAFTGAERAKVGYFEAAQGGTLLLDEIGEMPMAMQAKLLRVLESRQVVRLGGTNELAVDVRVIAATHRDLNARIEEGQFREDLYYRLSGFTLKIPPLRERPTDREILTEVLVRDASAAMKRSTPTLDAEAAARLAAHPWPGNVRELRNAIEHALVLADDRILVEHLPESLREQPAPPDPETSSMKDKVSALEKQSLIEALDAEGGNQTRAAKRLGISRRGLIYKMEKYGIKK